MPPRGDYQTQRKDAVEAYFEQNADRCLTAEDCCRQLSSEGVAIGITTIYRAITRLYEAGRLRRYAPSERGKAATYQYNGCQDQHLHMVCRMCGSLHHLKCEDVERFREHLLEEHNFLLDEGQTVLYGLCAKCLACARAGAAQEKEGIPE